ncbi:hypothetical protein BBOH_1099 [Bifidobacterium bohemicum DSM 22767]|uniref:DUF4192 family protein n=2 Tax=Bifidobacterium bohemicum TaxID=638617 RepID=A0A086ZG42_9BIFI|nr:hypothetical protein BBOH_1099 [Bifidobacterium bohemicum DSM 22767]
MMDAVGVTIQSRKRGEASAREQSRQRSATAPRDPKAEGQRHHKVRSYDAPGLTSSPVLSIERLEKAARVLQRRRMREGCEVADGGWLEHPLEQWCANLENGVRTSDERRLKAETGPVKRLRADEGLLPSTVGVQENMPQHGLDRMSLLSVSSQQALSVAMAQSLPVRDALILSLVGDFYGEHGRRTMCDFIAKPHDAANVRLLYRTLAAAFNDGTTRPDFERCMHGVAMLKPMTENGLERFCVQPCCVTAYALWWLDEPSARAYVLRALKHDEQCVLARVLLSAIVKGTRPAWAQAAVGI